MRIESIHNFTHPITISVVLCVLFFIIFPVSHIKYSADIVSVNDQNPNIIIVYEDLDFDGFSEKILFDNSNHPIIIIYKNGKIVNQWNIRGKLANSSFYNFRKEQGSKVKCIDFAPTYNDSIFLYTIEDFNTNNTSLKRIFIDKYDDKINDGIASVTFIENYTDGNSNIVLSCMNGYKVLPRNLYSIDLENKIVNKSPESGTIILNNSSFDLDKDGSPEYLGKSCAYGNFFRSDIHYPDTAAYLMVIDSEMEFDFEPKSFGSYKSLLKYNAFVSNGQIYIIALQTHQGNEDVKNCLYLFDTKGNLLKENQLPKEAGMEQVELFTNNKETCEAIYLIYPKDKIIQIDADLDPISECKVENIQNIEPLLLNLDNEEGNELVFIEKNQQGIVITQNDLSFPVYIPIDNPNYKAIGRFSIKKTYESKTLHFFCGNRTIEVAYSKSKYWILSYFIYPAVFLLFLLFFTFLQRVLNQRLIKRHNQQKQLSELQLKSIRGQLEPHFTLNLIESIGNLFYKNDNEKAEYVFGKYSNLLRQTILGSDDISTNLVEEISYIENYIELERFRYDYCFDYLIIGSELLEEYKSIRIPKMLLHTFVENAIKHGIKHKMGKSLLEVKLEYNQKMFLVSIKDDGVGRKQAKEYAKFSTGQGLKILDKMLALYKDLEKVKISYKIEDVISIEGDALGTIVYIYIPIKGLNEKAQLLNN